MQSETSACASSLAERVLLLLPTRRDREVTRALLAGVGIASEPCTDLPTLAAEMQRGVGAVMLTELALSGVDAAAASAPFRDQPAWSDIPVLLLTPGQDASAAARRLTGAVGNVTLLDRPVWKRSLVSAVLAALRSRRRQYELRDQLEALRQAEEALRLDHRHKDEFLAILAHELRNPLAPLRTGLQVLARPQADAKTVERMHVMMNRQLAHLVRLIDELLDISRVTTGKLVLQRVAVDLRAVLDAAIEAAQPGIDAGRHAIALDVPKEPVWVLGDFTRLCQAVGNLLSNAVKYTPPGGRIALMLEADQRTAILRVRDSGLGIPPEMLERVFDMFAQVPRTIDKAQGGLGVGLALVRRLVELHGGVVRAASGGANRGSEFTIELPRLSPDRVADSQAAPPQHVPAVAPRRHILIVDDNRDAADAMSAMLKAEGHVVRTEYGGADAIAALATFAPDAVICDLGMPGIDGYRVAAHVRATAALDGVQLVALSGWGSAEHVSRARAAGFDAHVIKPAALVDVQSALAAAAQAR